MTILDFILKEFFNYKKKKKFFFPDFYKKKKKNLKIIYEIYFN
jgi:hypothetical protein